MTSSSSPTDQLVARLALFALWSGCAPAAPLNLTPAFTLDGLVTSPPGSSLHQAAALVAEVGTPCWLVAGSETLSLLDASLRITIADSAPAESATAPARETARECRPLEFPLPPGIGPDAPVLVFGGYARLATTPAELRKMQAAFTLVGPRPDMSAAPADYAWAASLLPATDRVGYEWAILLGHSVAYDPPWQRDAE